MKKGLVQVKDLGEYWEEIVGLPIPLGGIVIKRKFSNAIYNKVNRIIKRSIQYAFDNPSSSMDYVVFHAQEMDVETIKKHINLYVNNFSISLGNEGSEAIKKIFTLRGKSAKQIFP